MKIVANIVKKVAVVLEQDLTKVAIVNLGLMHYSTDQELTLFLAYFVYQSFSF